MITISGIEPGKVFSGKAIIFDGGEYALLIWKDKDGKTCYQLSKETGRKLRHGKRRAPVAFVRED